jgi:hypothetical protein
MATSQIVVARKNYPRSIRSYTGMMLLVLIAAGVYGYLQFQKLSDNWNAIATEQALAVQLQTAGNQFSADYTELKATFDKNFAAILNSIQGVYPTEEDYTELTRTLDKFFQATNSSLNPIFASNLQFSQARIDDAHDYAILPLTMTISATRENFEKFMKYIENSGALEEKTRLMEITSISINFASQPASAFTVSPTAAEIPLLNVSVSMNAYFQKPVTWKPAAT